MILTFVVMGEIIQFRVDKDRILFMRGRHTNNSWIAFSEAVKVSKQEGKEAEMTEKIVKCLPELDDVEWYVKHECKRMGLEHLRTEEENV